MNATKYQVITDYLIIRKNKSLLSKTLGILKKGDIVEVTNINFLIATIQYNNDVGYVFSYGLQGYEEIRGSITINYLDTETNEIILANEIHNDLSLGQYVYEAKTISDYTLVSSPSITVLLTKENPNQIITFKYKKVLGSITVQYVCDTVVLASTVYENLALGEYTYLAKSFTGYQLASEESMTIKLTATQPTQTATFQYKPIRGSVTIQHVCNHITLEVAVHTNLSLGEYTYLAKSFLGYQLTSKESLTVTLTDEQPHQVITFEYTPILGSITVQYVCDDLILDSTIDKNLPLGDYTYLAKSFSSYQLSSEDTIIVTLTEEQPHQVITFEYTPTLGSITVQYVCDDLILDSTIDKNLPLGDYTYLAKSFSGYQLASEGTVIVALTEEQPHQVITFEYILLHGSVMIQYLDGETNTPLLPDEIYSLLTLGTYSYVAKDIEGYTLKSNQVLSVTLTDEVPNQTITFTYEKTYGSVVIQYIDTDSKVIISPTETYSQLEPNTYTYDALNIEGYQLITTTPITVTLTIQDPAQTIIFEYKKEEESEFLPLDESLQNEVPYISTYYIKPIVAPGEEVIIDYYITDYYHKEYTDDDYSDTFTVTVHIEDHPDIILRNLKAGDHSVSLGSFTLEREQKFSILCSDQYGRNSHELFNFFLVRTEPEVKEYVMTEEDLITYNIKNTDDYEELLEVPLTLATVNATTIKEALTEFASTYTPKPNTYTCLLPKTSDTDDPARWWASIVTKYADDYNKETVATQSQNTRIGLQQLLDNKAAEGYNKLKLLPGTYRIDHTGTIYIPTKFTLDLNQATIKLNQFTGNKSLMIDLNNTFDSHVVNGTIEGDFYSHDYAGSTNNSEWVNGISIGGEAKYSSFEDLTIKNITGYGSTNGIANSRDGALGYTYIYPRGIGNNFKIGDIDQTTGVDIISTNRTTSDFRDISGYGEIGYLTVSVYLGYQGNPCGTWNFIAHFYDVNKNYITSTSAYQYRRIGVPKNANYLRVTILSESYPTNLSVQLFRVPTHCSFQNCNHDNCRCVGMAPAAMKDMYVNSCEFTRCGWSSAKCALDAEDGWDMMQDVTLKKLTFTTNPNNELLTCAGHNFIIDNCSTKVYIWGRTRNTVIKNSNINGGRIHNDGIIKTATPRIINNLISQALNTVGDTQTVTRDSKAFLPYNPGKFINCIIFRDNSTTYTMGGGEFIDCNITFDKSGYLAGNILFKNCTFSTLTTNATMQFSFNQYDVERKFINCTFITPTKFINNNQFNSACFENCIFPNITLSPNMKQIGNGEITFNKCKLNKIPQYEKSINNVYLESDSCTKIIFIDCIISDN